jgi:hypothetical protein
MTAAGWYGDPSDASMVRWWDGTEWTEHVAPGQAPAQLSAGQDHGLIGPGHSVGSPGGATPSPVVVVDGRATVAAGYVVAGWTPEVCVRHGRRPVATRKATFLSPIPLWMYATILAGLLIFVILVSVLRKKVVAPAWPLCDQCLAERRRNLTLMWVSIAAFVPLIWAGSALSETMSGSALPLVLLALAIVGSPVAAVGFGNRGSVTYLVKGSVSADGSHVSFDPSHLTQRSSDLQDRATALPW